MIKLKQYRDKWLAEGVDNFVGFYNREFFCLDNFSSFGIEYNGKYYATIEHAYQAGKFFASAPDITETIRVATSAYQAKIIAQENKIQVDPKFDEYKVSFMEELLRLKIAQHSYVLKKLLETENCYICEDSPKDEFWGIGEHRKGQNQLGKLWMKLRAEFQKMTLQIRLNHFIDKLVPFCSKETAYPKVKGEWSFDNVFWGHCAIIAVLVFEEFGGEIWKGKIKGTAISHYYNIIDSEKYDMTACQYADEIEMTDVEKVSVDKILSVADTKKRYELLKSLLERNAI